MKFKFGQRVRLRATPYDATPLGPEEGWTGIVRGFDIDREEIGVDFGKRFMHSTNGGHDLGGAIRTDTGWFIAPAFLAALRAPVKRKKKIAPKLRKKKSRR